MNGRAVRFAAAVVCVALALPVLLLTWGILTSRFGPPSSDPHGYVLIFGTFIVMVLGFVLSQVVPFTFPVERRTAAWRISLVVYSAAFVLLALNFVTAP